MTIREKLYQIEKLAAEIDADLPREATTISRHNFDLFAVRTVNIGAPLDRIRTDAATILSHLPRGTQ